MRGRLGYDSPNRAWEIFKYHKVYAGEKPWGVYHPRLSSLSSDWTTDFGTWQEAMDFVNECIASGDQ